MRRREYSWYAWLFMLLAVAVLAGLYFLPSEIAGIRVKRIDLLATLREPILANESFLSAEEIFAETNAETPPILIHEDTLQLSLEDSLAQVEANEARLRDLLYQALVIAEFSIALRKAVRYLLRISRRDTMLLAIPFVR